ncbi:MAG TPA: ABC transporter ATP-binding protein [Gemmatimonadaceae bacterium]|nr:ABC transporter ATP-binding protein [Gemmatimonadaceae bacterium]
MPDVHACSWPITRLTEGVAALASATGLEPRAVPHMPASLLTDSVDRRIEALGAALSIGVTRVRCGLSDLDEFLQSSAPSIVRLPAPDDSEFLLLLGSARDVIWVLDRDLGRRAVRRAELRALLCRHAEAPLAESISRLLDGAGLNGKRRSQAVDAMLRQQLRGRCTGLWTVHSRPTTGFLRLAGRSRLGWHLAGFLVCHVTQYCLLLASWWLIGAAALQGRIDFGWLQAWGLLLLTRIPLLALGSWYQGVVAARAGSLLKQRLLEGTFQLAPEDVRRDGVGHTLSRVMESEVMETLALGGGFLALVAVVELVAAAVVLAYGAGGALHVLGLALWTGMACVLGASFWRHRRRWTASRLALTRSSIELMIGHRTRLVQRSGTLESEAEGSALAEYHQVSEAMDRAAAKLVALVPRGWLLAGLLILAPSFVGGMGSTVGLAVGLGGILLAYRALERGVAGFALLADAAVAWREAAAVFQAGGHEEPPGDPVSLAAIDADPITPPSGWADRAATLLEAHGLAFDYPGGARRVLRDCSFRIDVGDRVLLEATSGAGSSALVSIVGGLRRQDAGVLLLDGLDRRTLGADAWARLVSTVAQPHENHVFTNTLAFNLLMGRRWPPEPEDLQDAEAVCRELGLGPLVQRMPGGLHQVVGDTGWQLSQGERARLFIGRALLQGARLVTIDAALSSLDAESLEQVLRCVASRAPSVLVTTLAGDDRP